MLPKVVSGRRLPSRTSSQRLLAHWLSWRLRWHPCRLHRRSSEPSVTQLAGPVAPLSPEDAPPATRAIVLSPYGRLLSRSVRCCATSVAHSPPSLRQMTRRGAQGTPCSLAKATGDRESATAVLLLAVTVRWSAPSALGSPPGRSRPTTAERRLSSAEPAWPPAWRAKTTDEASSATRPSTLTTASLRLAGAERQGATGRRQPPPGTPRVPRGHGHGHVGKRYGGGRWATGSTSAANSRRAASVSSRGT